MHIGKFAQIEREYVYGIEKNGRIVYPSLKELAIKYEVPYSTLKTYSSKFGWTAKRMSNVGVRLLDDSEELKEQASAQIADLGRAAALGIETCTQLLTQLQRLVSTGENIRMNTSLVRTLSEALKNFAAVQAAVKPTEAKEEVRYVVEFSGLKNADAGN